MDIVSKLTCGFYYEQLEIDQQCLYCKIGMAISHYEQDIIVNENDIESIHKVMIAIRYDNPEFCYWSPDNVEIDATTVTFFYCTESEEEARNLVSEIRKKRELLIKELQSEKIASSLKEILFKVYLYLTEHITYASDELQKPACSQWIYDIQGPLLREKGVCLGISLAVNYICMALHIPSILITGEAKVAGWVSNHGWNLVEINGEYYHLDVTGDICGNSSEGFRYFLVKDKDLSGRQWPRSVYPEAV